MEEGLSGLALYSMLLKLGLAIMAMVLAVVFLRLLDRWAGHRFSHSLEVIRRSSVATSIYFGLRWIGVMLLFGSVLGCSMAAQAQVFSSRYDRQIREAVDLYWPDLPDHLLWKAQLYQESRLNPNAVSPVGAAGLAQFMPATWSEVARQLRLPAGTSPHSEFAIGAGAFYMAQLRRRWSPDRQTVEAHQLAQASYNAGAGNINRAARLCSGRVWSEIAPCLHRVTGERNAHETRTYIERIARWRAMMAVM